MTTTTQPTPNIPLLHQAIDFIIANPDAHRQSDWGWEEDLSPSQSSPCGSAMCISGWAVYFDDPANFRTNIKQAYAGHRVLGLTDSEADQLFSGSNTLEDILAAAARIESRAIAMMRAAHASH